MIVDTKSNQELWIEQSVNVRSTSCIHLSWQCWTLGTYWYMIQAEPSVIVTLDQNIRDCHLSIRDFIFTVFIHWFQLLYCGEGRGQGIREMGIFIKQIFSCGNTAGEFQTFDYMKYVILKKIMLETGFLNRFQVNILLYVLTEFNIN